jgi:hypothetical protein
LNGPILYREIVTRHEDELCLNLDLLNKRLGHVYKGTVLGEIFFPTIAATIEYVVASWAGHQGMAQHFISYGAMVNGEGEFYVSALQAVCWSEEKQVGQALLQAGADAGTVPLNF